MRAYTFHVDNVHDAGSFEIVHAKLQSRACARAHQSHKRSTRALSQHNNDADTAFVLFCPLFNTAMCR